MDAPNASVSFAETLYGVYDRVRSAVGLPPYASVEEEDEEGLTPLFHGESDSEDDGEVGSGRGSGSGSGSGGLVARQIARQDARDLKALHKGMQCPFWVATAAKTLSGERGEEGQRVDLDELLFQRDITRDTKRGYLAAVERWEGYLEGEGVEVESGAWMELDKDTLAKHMVAHIMQRSYENQSGALSFLGQLKGGVNYVTIRADKLAINPFTHHSVITCWKSVTKQAKKFRSEVKQAQTLGNGEHRSLTSYTVQQLHRRSAFVISNFRTSAAVNFAMYKGVRGDTTRSTKLDHLSLISDSASPFQDTLWVHTAFSKTDQEGKGVFWPLLRLKDDGYRCPALILAMYLLLVRPLLEAADRDCPPVRDSKGKLKVRRIYLFPASGRNGELNFLKPWSGDSATRELRGLAQAALGLPDIHDANFGHPRCQFLYALISPLSVP